MLRKFLVLGSCLSPDLCRFLDRKNSLALAFVVLCPTTKRQTNERTKREIVRNSEIGKMRTRERGLRSKTRRARNMARSVVLIVLPVSLSAGGGSVRTQQQKGWGREYFKSVQVNR